MKYTFTKKSLTAILLIFATTLFINCTDNDYPLYPITSGNSITRTGDNNTVCYEEAYPNEKTDTILNCGLQAEVHDSLIFIQGDVQLSKEQIEYFNSAPNTTRSAYITSPIKYWKDGIVYYTINNNVTSNIRSRIIAAIDSIELKTSVSFVNGHGSGDYIEFYQENSGGTYSQLGKIGGRQQIHIDTSLSETGNIIHELGHSLGLLHEHCRADRDNYIIVYWDNILSNKRSQFQKYTDAGIDAIDFGPFDQNSIMLYGSHGFTINPFHVSMTYRDGSEIVTQRSNLSPYDVAAIESIYGPPYHSLSQSTIAYSNENGGGLETEDIETSNKIYFYTDRSHSQRTTMNNDRRILVNKKTTTYRNGERETRDDYYVVVAHRNDSEIDLGSTYTSMRYEYGIMTGYEEYIIVY